MSDTRHFLRYVTPGLVFAIELIILLGLFRHDWLLKLIDFLNQKESGIGGVIAAVLASGGLGAMFSALYHALLWRGGGEHTRDSEGRWEDYRPVIRQLAESDIIRFLVPPHDWNNTVVTQTQTIELASRLSREDALVIVEALWHERVNNCAKIKGANARTTEFSDQMHSAGTNFVASIFAAIFAILAILTSHPAMICCVVIRVVGMMAVATIVSWAFYRNFRRVAYLVRAFYCEVLSDALVAERIKSNQPLLTWPFPRPR